MFLAETHLSEQSEPGSDGHSNAFPTGALPIRKELR